MMYKTIVIDYAPKAKKMAAAIENTANEKAQDGWELVTFSVTNSAKAILVFRTPDAVPQGRECRRYDHGIPYNVNVRNIPLV